MSGDRLRDEIVTIFGEHRVEIEAIFDGLRTERDAAVARAKQAEQALEEALGILNALIDPDDCWFDHHGYCQAHGWMETDPVCPHRRAKDVFALDGEYAKGNGDE